MDIIIPKDKLGNEIEIGDTIIYPGRIGSSCCLRVGNVDAFEYYEYTSWRKSKEDEKIEIKIIIPKLKVTVTEKTWSGVEYTYKTTVIRYERSIILL